MKLPLNVLLTVFSVLITGVSFTSQLQLPTVKTIFTTRQCMMCRFSMSLINYALRTNRGHDQIYKIANTYCQIARLESPAVCSSITRLFNQEIVKVLSYGVVTPNQVCGYLSNNTCGYFTDPMGDWEVNLKASINLNHEQLSTLRDEKRSMAQRSNKPYRVIQISDTHIDLNYRVGSISNCGEPLCCRPTSTRRPTEPIIPAGFWGSYGECDIPLTTFEATLKYINETIHSGDEISYILWTGDIQPHDVWIQNRHSSIQTFDAVFSAIFKHLPNVRIFPTFGNHEMVPVDSFSPSNLLAIARDDSPEWLYKKFDGYWSRWLPEGTLTTITKDGFYAVSVQSGLKLISLNTNFCHNTNFWLYINSTDPGNQLQWLVHELQLSELEHEQVHIIGHIPPGSDDCLKVWSRNYNRIIRRFSNTITGQFFGHTHNNEFEMFYANDPMKPISTARSGRRRTIRSTNPAMEPISVGFIGPSVTTFVGLNPSFRTYTIDPNQKFMPVDFDTYYMNLTEANLKGSKQIPKWYHTGMFSKMFGLNDTSPKSMQALLMDLTEELGTLESFQPIDLSSRFATPGLNSFQSNEVTSRSAPLSKLYRLYQLFNGLSDQINQSKFDKLTPLDKKNFLCKFFTSQSHNLSACKQAINQGFGVSINQLA